jgi:hypothetical protein
MSLEKKCVDCITGITSTNKIVHRLISRIICVVVVIEPTPIHFVAHIHPSNPHKHNNCRIGILMNISCVDERDAVHDISNRNDFVRAVEGLCAKASRHGRHLSPVCMEGAKRMGVPRYGEKGRRRFVLIAS